VLVRRGMVEPPAHPRAALLRAGIAAGILMVIVPMALALAGMSEASRVQGGLRGATHRPERAEEVGVALGGASLVALLAPPGVLLAVLSALALAGDRRGARRGSAIEPAPTDELAEKRGRRDVVRVEGDEAIEQADEAEGRPG